MHLYERIEVDFKNVDNRGELVQLIHDGFKQVNYLFSKKGVVRGGHYHKTRKEAFYLIKGKVEVTFVKNEKKEIVLFNEGDFFLISPYVLHSMYFLSDCQMMQLYDEPVVLNGVEDICRD